MKTVLLPLQFVHLVQITIAYFTEAPVAAIFIKFDTGADIHDIISYASFC